MRARGVPSTKLAGPSRSPTGLPTEPLHVPSRRLRLAFAHRFHCNSRGGHPALNDGNSAKHATLATVRPNVSETRPPVAFPCRASQQQAFAPRWRDLPKFCRSGSVLRTRKGMLRYVCFGHEVSVVFVAVTARSQSPHGLSIHHSTARQSWSAIYRESRVSS